MSIGMDVMRALRTYISEVTEDFFIANPDKPRTVFIGWPSRPQILEAHAKKEGERGRTLISIFMPEGMENDVTRYAPTPCQLTPCSRAGYIVDPGDLADQTEHRRRVRIVENEEAIFTTAFKTGKTEFPEGDVVGLCVGPPQDDPAVSYVTEDGDSIEEALDALVTLFNDPTDGIVVDRPWLTAFRNGTDFVVRYLPGIAAAQSPPVAPPAEHVTFVLGGQAQIGFETKRTQRIFWVNIWAPSPTIRDDYQTVLEGAFAQFVTSTSVPGVFNRLMLADGSKAVVFTSDSFLSDEEQLENNWRCTIALSAEYSTMEIVRGTEVICTNVSVSKTVLDCDPVHGVGRKNGEGVFVRTWTGQRVPKSVYDQLAALLSVNQPGCKL